jgi:hypothetical protein
VRCTPGVGFTRADLHRPGPHVDATNYKGKILLNRVLWIELTEVLNVPWIG